MTTLTAIIAIILIGLVPSIVAAAGAVWGAYQAIYALRSSRRDYYTAIVFALLTLTCTLSSFALFVLGLRAARCIGEGGEV